MTQLTPKYRKRGWPLVLGGGLNEGTAFSAIEQALWDLSGQALGVPVYDLLGGKLHNRLKVYANINRATVNRIPAEFAEKAAQAAEQGFCGVKAAVFDGFPNRSASRKEKERAIINGIACVAAMRRAIGPDVRLMVDCHSFFNVEMAIDVAQRLEPFNLYWYEEPVSPKQIEDTAYIHKSIKQPMAGGEFIFGAEGFSPLCRSQGVDIIMPDVNHCGGILEGYYISRNAEVDGIAVAPHNPYGPVTTAAAIQLCAGLPNFDMLEYQWGETEWRKDLTDPPEHIEKGYITIPDRPGLGVTLQP